MLKHSRGSAQDTIGMLLAPTGMSPIQMLGSALGAVSTGPVATNQSGFTGLPIGTTHAVQRVLQFLSQREEQVVRMRYGIGTRLHSVDEISDQLGMMPMQIARIEVRAFRKLREVTVVGDLLERPTSRPEPFRGDNRGPTPPRDPRRLPDDPEREANPWDEV